MPMYIVTARAYVFPDFAAATKPPSPDTPIIERCTRFEGKPSTESGAVVEKTDAPAGVVKHASVWPIPAALPSIISDAGKTMFCLGLTDAAAEEKADRNYLLSSAYFLSNNLSEFGKPTDPTIGPFAYSDVDWCDDLERANAAGHSGIKVQHVFEPVGQATVAAVRTGQAMKNFKVHHGELPLPVQLFFYERLGEDALKLLALNPAKLCSDAFTIPPREGSYAARIKGKTISDEIKKVTDGLTAGFINSRADIERLPPHLRYYSDEDFAPWLAVARLMTSKDLRAEKATLAGKFLLLLLELGNDDRLSAAFVSFCLIQCGVEKAKKKALDMGAAAALPDTWSGSWAPEARDPPPVGSIVVTIPDADGNASVGILAAPPKGDQYEVYLCSENKAVDAAISVGKETIAKSKIATLRWFNLYDDDSAFVAGAGAPVQPGDNLKSFHGIFSDLGGARWKLTSSGLLIEGEAAPKGSGGTPLTVTEVWNRWKNEIVAAAQQFSVPIELIIATICTESRGQEDAVRHEPGYISDEATPGRVSIGMMQTLISTARGEAARLNVQPSDITAAWLKHGNNSIRAGTSYIARQKNGTGFDPPLVACAYNAGSVRRNDSPTNRWKMVQYPIGTSAHADRWVGFFNDCFQVLAPASAPDPSFVRSLNQ